MVLHCLNKETNLYFESNKVELKLYDVLDFLHNNLWVKERVRYRWHTIGHELISESLHGGYYIILCLCHILKNYLKYEQKGIKNLTLI